MGHIQQTQGAGHKPGAESAYTTEVNRVHTRHFSWQMQYQSKGFQEVGSFVVLCFERLCHVVTPPNTELIGETPFLSLETLPTEIHI